jgi:hypothetical protein
MLLQDSSSPRRTQRLRLVAVCLLTLSAITAFAAGAQTWLKRSGSAVGESGAYSVGEQVSVSTTPTPFSVNRPELDPHVSRALNSLGDRFERQEKLRTILSGTLVRSRGATTETVQVTITREPQDRLRYEERSGVSVRTLGSDGKNFWSSAGATPSSEETALIEALVRDTIEHFISGQVAGDALRVLGNRYRLDDGSDPKYTGPYYDILNVADTLQIGDQKNQRSTLYYLNSETGLPERIVYEPKADARVEVEFSAWRILAGQQIPARIVRRENGVLTEELTVTQAMFGPALPDGIFTSPTAK